MMLRHKILDFVRPVLAVAFLVAGSMAHAQSVKLQAHEIDALLSGNTVVGQWEGAKYAQYFDPDGHTIYAQDGSRSARGQWRTDPEQDEFQSIWPSDAEWQGWFVMEFGGDFYWVSKSTPPTLFEVLDGLKLVDE